MLSIRFCRYLRKENNHNSDKHHLVMKYLVLDDLDLVFCMADVAQYLKV